MEGQLDTGFDPKAVNPDDWFHARSLVVKHQTAIDGVVRFLSSLSADDMNHAQNLFGKYNLETVRNILNFVSRPTEDTRNTGLNPLADVERESTTTLQTISSASSTPWTLSSRSSVFSDVIRSSDASSGKPPPKYARSNPRSDYPCFCTFHQELGDQKPLNRKSDWKRHEETFHNSDEIWHCSWCTEKFGSFKALEAHCKNKRVHSKLPSKNEVFHERFLPRVRFACGFPACKYNGLLHSWDKRCDHLADHMKEDAELKLANLRDDQWAAEQWSFTTRVLRLLKQPEIEQHWREIMTSAHGPEVWWRPYWKPNDRSLTLVHKLECRDFRPSPKEVAQCAVYLAWHSADGNAPDISRSDNFIRKVLRPPTENNLSRRLSLDLDETLKRFSETQLRQLPLDCRPLPQSDVPPPAADNDHAYGNATLHSSPIPHSPWYGVESALETSFFDSGPYMGNPIQGALHVQPEENDPHPLPNHKFIPFGDPTIAATTMDVMEIDTITPAGPHRVHCVGTAGGPVTPQWHRRPGQLIKHMANSLSLPHRAQSSG